MNTEPQVIITMKEWEELKAKKTIPEMLGQIFLQSKTMEEFLGRISEMKWRLDIGGSEISVWVSAECKKL